MTDAAPIAPAPTATAKPGWWSSFSFTDDGCRTEVRLGALLMLAAVFLWLFLGPSMSVKLWWLGAPLFAVGIPLQAWQARDGRPGFPWKLGVAMALFGALMWPDVRYRQSPGGPVMVQEVAPLLLGAGLWVLLWWPVARMRRPAAEAA